MTRVDAGLEVDRLRRRPARRRRTAGPWPAGRPTSGSRRSPRSTRRGARSTASSAARRGPRRRRRARSPGSRSGCRALAASAASAWPPPVVSLPSESRTIRFWASSGKSAVASRSAAPMSVARLDRRRGDPVDLARAPTGSRSTSASLPNATMPGDVALGHHLEGLAQERERVLAARRCRPSRTGRRRTRSRAGRPAGRAGTRRARRRARQQERADDEGDPAPAGADPPARGEVQAERQRERRDQQERARAGASKRMPIRRSRRRARAPEPRRRASAGRG